MPELRIEGTIGDVFNTAEDIRMQVESLGIQPGQNLNVLINSPGGSVFEGFAIYNYLRSLSFPVFMQGEGLVGSIATLIMSAAPKENTSISEVSMFMIHRAVAPAMGNTEDLTHQAEILATIDQTLADVYTARTGKPRDEIIELMSQETWLSGRETVEAGFVGALTNPIPAEAVASAFITPKNQKEMSLKSFIQSFQNNGDASEVVEGAKNKVHEDDDEKDKVKNKAKNEDDDDDDDKDKKENVSRAEFDALSGQFSEFAASMDKFTDVLQNILKSSETTAKAQSEKTTEIAASITKEVKAEFQNMVASLPTSKGGPVEGDVITDKTKESVWSKHRAEMAEINKTAKAKLKSIN